MWLRFRRKNKHSQLFISASIFTKLFVQKCTQNFAVKQHVSYLKPQFKRTNPDFRNAFFAESSLHAFHRDQRACLKGWATDDQAKPKDIFKGN
jgi:hypothetical protein